MKTTGKKSLRLVGQVPIDFQLASWYHLLLPAYIMQLLKKNVLLSVLWLNLISLRVCCSKCVQYQPLWCLKKKSNFLCIKIRYNFIFDFTTSLIHIFERNVRSFWYFEGNSMQSYYCHALFQVVLLYPSLPQPILYQLWNCVYHLAWEYICCDYTCHGVCQAKQKLAKVFSILGPNQTACCGKHLVMSLFRCLFYLQISLGGLSL